MFSLFSCIVKRVLRTVRSNRLPKPTSGVGRFVYKSNRVSLNLNRHPTSQIVLNGNVYLQSDLGDRGFVNISMAENSILLVDGDLILGPGVHLQVCKNATLTFGGRKSSSGSGITCNTRVMVNQNLTIGSDCLIAWDCFISDCDWHQIHNQPNTISVKIGDGVWVAQGVTILKGSNIGSGSIVASKSVVAGGVFGPQSLIAGNPARVVRHPVAWSRDLDPTH
ncbi:acyltransferase [Novipirellula artificiosorum]|uniref:Virginiamycin A acetyltransferase n=1 Tax=Novipirellula artificiosorum TaxID=2528016 RepID=A0A5C6D706_9BACT|nr:hypothetical protein [Novipirellula artificiosorum]TWU32600.1 Virginiamycin A acetyltransferase [Novipirellula artificiosorum]